MLYIGIGFTQRILSLRASAAALAWQSARRRRCQSRKCRLTAGRTDCHDQFANWSRNDRSRDSTCCSKPIPMFHYTEGKPDYQCFLSESWNDRKGQFDLFSLPRHSEPVSQHRLGNPFPRENVRIPAAFIAVLPDSVRRSSETATGQSLPLRGEGGSPRSHARGETDEVSAPQFVQRFKRTGLPPHPPFGHLPLKGEGNGERTFTP